MIRLVTFQGPSGSGKSTLQQLLELPKIVSLTSREMREEEKDGVEYWFTTKEQIYQMDMNGELLETSTYNGNVYATTLVSINTTDSNNPHSIVVDYNGVNALRYKLGKSLFSIGVYAPRKDCENRLLARGGNAIARMNTYDDEINQLFQCDLIIINSDENRLRANEIILMIKDEIKKRIEQF